MVKVDIANSKFVGFTEERLVRRLSILSDIINDEEALDDEIAEAALLRKEVKECLKVYEECQEMGLDTSGMTTCDIIETVTGESIESLQKQTPGGLLAQDVIERTGSVFKSATTKTKQSVNKFAGWLSTKTAD